MRIESSVTSISWIPSEAIGGMTRMPFDVGVAHYDSPPPDHLEDLEELRAADRFRFANRLQAWIEVEDGRITGHGYSGQGLIGSTTMKLGGKAVTFPGVPLPDRRQEPEVREDSVRFVQTAGGRTGVPMPRRVARPPFVQVAAPLAWTTLALTIYADGHWEHEVAGASPFPRHWIYDHSGDLVGKTGLIDFKSWYLEAFGSHTPWGDQDSPALVTAVETALERQLTASLMRDRPAIRNLAKGTTLVEQGQEGDDLYVLLDGVLSVEVDGKAVAEVGPGAVLGERAALEGGKRTATLRAATPIRVAIAPAAQVAGMDLAQVARGHRREEG